MTDYRALITEMADELDHNRQCLLDDRRLTHPLADHARALLAEPDGPAVPDGREPASIAGEPSDREIYAWITECADATRRGPLKHYWAFDVQFDHVRDIVHAVLARWGRPATTPVPVLPDDALVVPVAQPVPVSERLPEPSTKVLAHYFNSLGKGRTVCAIWVPAKSRSDDFDLSDDDFTEYDEETDKFYWPEGWYETIENWDDLGYVKIYDGEVIYWQPFPQWPAHALPVPGEVTS